MEFLSGAALIAATVVVLVQQILKLNLVPLAFANRYPVPTNILLSIVATLFVVKPAFNLSNLPGLFVQVGTVAVVAAISYNQLLGKWSQLKAAEGEGK
jgi:hypothetical protein